MNDLNPQKPLPMAAVLSMPTRPTPRPIDTSKRLADVVLLRPAHKLDLFFGSITGVAW